jgi:peptidoglycan/xylan/chitin deacetylase (PgdA/CDA1 family)
MTLKMRGIGRLRGQITKAWNRFRSSALILLYHRVSELETDPFEQAVSPGHFEEHLEVLTKHWTPMRLSDVLEGLSSGRMPRRAVAVTFDDGYADNLYVAMPILRKFGVPATFFISTGPVCDRTEFFWDELEDLCFGPGALRGVGSLDLPGLGPLDRFLKAINEENGFHGVSRWRFENSGDPTARHQLFRHLYLGMRGQGNRSRSIGIELLRRFANHTNGPRDSHRPMTCDEVARVAGDELFEIGGHTRSHAMLPEIPMDEQRSEIEGGKAELELMIGKPISAFSYPYGKFNDAAVALVRSAGYASACTTCSAPVRSGSDPYRLPRFWPRNYDGDRLCGLLRNWRLL